MALVLDTDPFQLLVPGKQFQIGTTGHPLSITTRRLDPPIGNCQQIKTLEDSKAHHRRSLRRLGLSVCQTMPDSPQGDISVQSGRNSGQKRNRPERSKARVRASIACVPCRSKHSKCDGSEPSCTRCKDEGTRCHYVSSRRGIRDPKKRNIIKSDVSMADQDDTTKGTPKPSLSSFDNSLRSQTKTLDLYYANFHVAHPWVLPREILEQHLKTTSNDMRFLEATIVYIASRYSKVDSRPLWERAYEMSRKHLPPTLWTVQALLSLSIASFGERDEFYRDLFIQARKLALRLGLQHKVYADKQEKSVAESCRRTYWGLYVHEMLLDMRDTPSQPHLYLIKSTEGTELPCEEWEYAAHTISTPVSLAEYDRLGASRDQSSWASLIDLVRIYDRCVARFLHGCETSSDALEDANQLIDSWRNALKGPKMEHVDEDGTVDMILYSALVISYGLQIRMQLHFDEVREVINGGHWNPYMARLHDGVAGEFDLSLPPILQAPLRLVSLFNHILAEKFSPSCIPYLGLAAGLLNAQSDHSNKVAFFSSILRKSGESWAKSKRISDYLDRTPMGAGHGTSHTAQSRAMTAYTDAIENTLRQANPFHPIMANAMGYTSSWPELDPRPVMSWPEVSSQSFSGSAMSSVVSATMAESFQSFDFEVDSVGALSPQVKVERWL